MKKKYSILLVFMLLFMGTIKFVHAQNPNRKEQVETFKIGFITRRLNLTADEAKSFWPVYNQFQNDLEELRKKHQEELASAKANFENLSEKELEKLVDNEVEFRQSEVDIFKKSHKALKKILKPRKLALLYKAQEDFKKELLNRIKDNNRK